MDYAALLRAQRKKCLAPPALFPEKIWADQTAIKKIIPHREPYLLLDDLRALDLSQGILVASRQIDDQDPVFRGHFPGAPVYPGCLQVEMIGQAGLCLSFFVSQQNSCIPDQAVSLNVRATKILGAHFLEPVLPGQRVYLAVKSLERDAYLGSVMGQLICNQRICAVAVCEVCFLE